MLFLLIAFSAFFHLAHPAMAEAHTGATLTIDAGAGADPCQHSPASAEEHCNMANACPLGVPGEMAAVMPKSNSARLPMNAELLVVGGVIAPQLHPPRLPLQA